MQTSIVSVNNDKNEKLYVKLCTRPNTDQKRIFDALNFKSRPYVRQTKVLTQLQKTKSQHAYNEVYMSVDFQVGLRRYRFDGII